MLAIVLTALFVAPFNGLARVIILAWAAGHAAYILGAPEACANLLGQSFVLIVGGRHLRCVVCLFAWALSVTLVAVNIAWCAEILSPALCWWTVLCVAMVQLLVLPLALDRGIMGQVVEIWRDHTGHGLFRAKSA